MTKEKELKSEEKSFATISVKSFISVVIILVTMIAICGILSLFVPQGHFLRNEEGEIIAGTFIQTEAQGLSF